MSEVTQVVAGDSKPGCGIFPSFGAAINQKTHYFFPLLLISGKDDSETHFVDYLSTINFRSENSK